MPLNELSAFQIAAQIKQKKVSCREVTDSFLARIESVEPRIRAFVTVTADEARQRADALDKRLANGEDLGLLGGVPIALKDVVCTRGVKTTASSKMLEKFIPPYDAHINERLQAEGAILLGKTNMDEFAMGSSTENSAFFPTHNPWDLERVPGGSSGGSAAAVAALEAPIALGTDTGGSIRQPAAYCGCVGVKPTYGLISRYGVIPFASSLDQVGPLTNTVRDSALTLQAIAGHDQRDSTSINRAVPDYLSALDGAPSELVKGLRIGVLREYFSEEVSPAVQAALRAAIDHLCDLGAEAFEVSLPTAEYALAAYSIIAPGEASSNLARYDGVQYGLRVLEPGDDVAAMYARTRSAGFGQEVQHRALLGTHILTADCYEDFYLKAQKVRTLICRDFEQAFEKCDLIAAPATATTAFKLGEQADTPFEMKLSDTYNIPANLAGLPALSLPCGFQDELPIGLQLIGKHLDETTLLRAAHAYEQSTEWHKRRAAL